MLGRMSTGTKTMLIATVVVLLLLTGNYLFAEKLYAYSFDPAWNAGTFNARGSEVAEPFAYPEDPVGLVLSTLLIDCVVAFVRQYKDDIPNMKPQRRSAVD
jgi:hypothetical protein